MKTSELSVFRGNDIILDCGLIIHQPTLDEICEYGEDEYFSNVCLFTATRTDLNWRLWDMGIDYTEITDFSLFCSYGIALLKNEKLKILFPNHTFKDCQYIIEEEEIVGILNKTENLIITIDIYNEIMDIVRKMHNFKKNEKLPANKTTKMILIEDAKEEYMLSLNKEHHSYLKNLISAMVNSVGFKYSYDTVWNLKIGNFMDAINRITKIKNADLLLQSGYSGFGISLNEIDNKQLDWLGEI